MTDTNQKLCQVCDTPNPAHARFCNHCGAALAIMGTTPNADGKNNKVGMYDPLYGEADLLETAQNWRSGIYVFTGLFVFLGLVGFGVWLFLNASMPTDGAQDPLSTPSLTPDVNALEAPLATPTPRPTLNLVTVTPAPPTSTPLPTPGPCERVVQANDTLIAIIASCGYTSLDVMSEVLELNGLADASQLRLGQVIQVPRPTATPDPNAAPTEPSDDAQSSSSSGSSFSSVLFADGAEGLPTFTPSPSPTLPPGIMFHRVQRGEDVSTLYYTFGASVEILAQLNPEMTFSQCEFTSALPLGGASCTVILIEGMQLRVPAPTPTPTLSPTPSGSETPTPQPTATFNAPSLVSPGNRVLFTRAELITLRWRGTGSLSTSEVYRVRVRNLSTGITYSVDVRDTFLIVPTEWQEKDGQRYDYEWQVSVIDLNNPDNVLFQTETRIFTWEALPASNT